MVRVSGTNGNFKDDRISTGRQKMKSKEKEIALSFLAICVLGSCIFILRITSVGLDCEPLLSAIWPSDFDQVTAEGVSKVRSVLVLEAQHKFCSALRGHCTVK